MAHIEQIQAQHVQNYDVVVYDRMVMTVEFTGWTDDGLIRLRLRKAGSHSCMTVEVSCDFKIETLVL